MRSRSASLPAEHHEQPRSSPSDIRSISLAAYTRESEEEDIAADNPFLPGKCELDTAIPMESRRPSEAEVPNTLRKATCSLFRFHRIDWLAIFALAILDVILNIINPFYRFVGKSMIGDYMFPLKSNTIPFEAVPVIALVIPLVIFVAYFLYTKDITDLHHATLGLFFAVLITAVLTDAIKDAVGRPRPDFFWRCFPNGNATYNNFTGEVECHGVSAVIKEGHKSFPSGHTSWSFAGLGFLSLYLAGKLQLFNGRGHVAKLAIVFTPLLAALLVGLSRVDDYWHHWQDVFAGALLGFVLAVLCYHHLFPSILGESGKPYRSVELGNNFELACFAWFPHPKPAEYPPTRENGEEHDVEIGNQ